MYMYVYIYIYIYIWGFDYKLANYDFKQQLEFQTNLEFHSLAICLSNCQYLYCSEFIVGDITVSSQ